MKRFLALALSVVMILCALLMAGCDQNGNDSTTKKPSGTAGTTAGTTGGHNGTTGGDVGDPTEPTGYEKMPGYEDVTFGGATFTLVGCDGEADGFNSAKEIYSEESDAISVAVRDRNATIEDLYDCTIKGVASATPSGDAMTEVTSNQHTIDIFTHHYTITGMATDGKCYNLKDLGSREIDFSQPWWDQKYVDSYTIKNGSGKETLYSIVGDFALTTFDCTHAIVYNKTVYENTDEIANIDIYQLVKDKKWTMDQFMFMIKEAASDSNGDSTWKSADGDVMGWIRTGHATHGLHVASGLSIFKTVNGAFTYELDKNTESWVKAVDKGIEVWSLPQGETLSYSDIPATIAGGKALFASEILGSSLGNLKDLDCEIGLLPYPLHSETQDNYAHYVDNHVYSYSVPTSVDEIENVGDFFAIYAYHSRYIVRPAYINTYAFEYCSDAQSADMLDIILSTMTYDPGYLSSTLESDVSNCITNGKNNIAKIATARLNTANEWITKFMDGINDNEV